MKTLSHNYIHIYIYLFPPFGLELRDIDIFQAPPNLNGKIRSRHRLRVIYYKGGGRRRDSIIHFEYNATLNARVTRLKSIFKKKNGIFFIFYLKYNVDISKND